MVCPLVGMRGVEHIADNARVFSFELDDQDLSSINEVLTRSKGPSGDIYSFERQ